MTTTQYSAWVWSPEHQRYYCYRYVNGQIEYLWSGQQSTVTVPTVPTVPRPVPRTVPSVPTVPYAFQGTHTSGSTRYLAYGNASSTIPMSIPTDRRYEKVTATDKEDDDDKKDENSYIRHRLIQSRPTSYQYGLPYSGGNKQDEMNTARATAKSSETQTYRCEVPKCPDTHQFHSLDEFLAHLQKTHSGEKACPRACTIRGCDYVGAGDFNSCNEYIGHLRDYHSPVAYRYAQSAYTQHGAYPQDTSGKASVMDSYRPFAHHRTSEGGRDKTDPQAQTSIEQIDPIESLTISTAGAQKRKDRGARSSESPASASDSVSVSLETPTPDETDSNSDFQDERETLWMSDWSEVPNTTEDEQDEARRQHTSIIAEKLLRAFESQYGLPKGYYARQKTAQDGGHGGANGTATTGHQKSGNTRPKRKLGQVDRKDAADSEDDECERDPIRGKARKLGRKKRRLLLACPFGKKDPLRYRACYGHTLTKISFVKQHLSRKHQLPTYCSVCMDTFDSEEARDIHIRARACEERPRAHLEGITRVQKEKLQQRVPAKLSEEEQWFTIFDILFPEHPRPQSAYIDGELSEELCSFREFATSKGPAIASQYLRDSGPGVHLQDAKLLCLVDTAVQEGFSVIFDTWLEFHRQQSHASTEAETQTSPSSSTRLLDEASSSAPSSAENAESNQDPTPESAFDTSTPLDLSLYEGYVPPDGQSSSAFPSLDTGESNQSPTPESGFDTGTALGFSLYEGTIPDNGSEDVVATELHCDPTDGTNNIPDFQDLEGGPKEWFESAVNWEGEQFLDFS
ncbi:hypothetical protein BU16DRAFT_581136 [Lophium mytilinum]|uniref:C2H2-type domain-containing protein n=1 Tax=Lophium mytilinum TaxID=390894 RepID=A0A6A6QY36_9PEZI|nr:hypothetical protein BU16DRAFT_581136 [Lophium mytilinum]